MRRGGSAGTWRLARSAILACFARPLDGRRFRRGRNSAIPAVAGVAHALHKPEDGEAGRRDGQYGQGRGNETTAAWTRPCQRRLIIRWDRAELDFVFCSLTQGAHAIVLRPPRAALSPTTRRFLRARVASCGSTSTSSGLSGSGMDSSAGCNLGCSVIGAPRAAARSAFPS
jgi:hypothetical protein